MWQAWNLSPPARKKKAHLFLGSPIYSVNGGLIGAITHLADNTRSTDVCSTLWKRPWYFAKREEFTKTQNRRQSEGSFSKFLSINWWKDTGVAAQAPYKTSDSFTFTKTDQNRGMKSRHAEWVSAVGPSTQIITSRKTQAASMTLVSEEAASPSKPL